MDVIRSIIITVMVIPKPKCAVQLPDLYWNSSNPIFEQKSSDRVVQAWMKDRLNIFCPYYEEKVQPTKVEYSVLYKVSAQSFRSCRLSNDAKTLMVCATPYRLSRPYSITFREVTANPTGLEFRIGKSYYFLSTSNGSKSGLRNAEGGLCSSKNMKLQINMMGYRKRLTGSTKPSYNAIDGSYISAAQLLSKQQAANVHSPLNNPHYLKVRPGFIRNPKVARTNSQPGQSYHTASDTKPVTSSESEIPDPQRRFFSQLGMNSHARKTLNGTDVNDSYSNPEMDFDYYDTKEIQGLAQIEVLVEYRDENNNNNNNNSARNIICQYLALVAALIVAIL